MRLLTLMALIALLAACGGPGSKKPEIQSEARRHIAMISDKADDTPEQMSLLGVALAEAEIAAQHAGFAALKPTDLVWMQQHAAHVAHAVNPAAEAVGPGKGYGVQRATEQIIEHMTLAAAASDATVNIKGESVRIHRSGKNVLGRCNSLGELARQVAAAGSAAQAAPLVQQMQRIADQLVLGVDKNGDGLVTWRRGEGGLATIREHLHYLR